jgi:hypothetical protein
LNPSKKADGPDLAKKQNHHISFNQSNYLTVYSTLLQTVKMAEETTMQMTAGNNFLTTFHNTVPKLFITAETDSMAEFDQVTLKHWRSEGRSVLVNHKSRRY